MDLDEASDELYVVAPGAFVQTRGALAARAAQAGDAQLARSIKRLRKPTASAWLTNLLTSREGPKLRALLEIGPAMEAAQARLAGDELRQLSQRRQQLLDALVQAAQSLAKAEGHSASAQTLREVEATLGAASADPTAAEALHRGHLTVPLEYAGFGALGAQESAPQRRGPRPDAHPGDDRARRAASVDANRRLKSAQRALERLEVRRDDHTRQLADLDARAEALRAEIAEIARSITEAEGLLKRVEADVARTQSDRPSR